jgi:hypothetical protein
MARPARLPHRVLDHLEKLGASTPNRSGFPIVEVPLAALDRLADAVPLRRN